MDDFARLPAEERRLFCEQAAAQLGFSAQIVEKDFWVCWSLKRLFALAEFGEHLTFKGGTSLSKAYHVIERFSEDVDLAIERSFLGFGGRMEPEDAPSGKEQQRRIEALGEACRKAIAERLEPQLREAMRAAIGDESSWALQWDPADKDRQTLLFQYPPAITAGLSPYFARSVRLEFGARSDHFPVRSADVSPYLQDALPGVLSDVSARVRVLAAERTFWEKATLLHMVYHYPRDKTIARGSSRHYYDLYQLSVSDVAERALRQMELLKRVATHKSVFFKAAWAKYEDARAGSLRLVPPDRLVAELRKDYEDMGPMFFGDPPEFDTILDHLRALENRINTAES